MGKIIVRSILSNYMFLAEKKLTNKDLVDVVSQHSKRSSTIQLSLCDSVKSIAGLLKDVKKTSKTKSQKNLKQNQNMECTTSEEQSSESEDE